MASGGSRLWIAERAIDVILLGALIVIAIFDPGEVGKIALPVICVLLIIGWIAAWQRRRK